MSINIYLFKIRLCFFILFIINLLEPILKDIIPKVSIFLPIYNKGNYLLRSIGSIQKQSLKNIEIIAVNDASTDNSLDILKKLAKKDKRIKIVNNDRNHGLLYSRSMGILNCTGEYLMNLDPDDKFEGDNNLKILYVKSKRLNSETIRFLIKRIALNEYEKNFYKKVDKNQFKTNDYLITNKFVKRKTFLKAYNIFKKNIYSSKWNYHEDEIWNFLIRKKTNFISNINKFIYIYKKNNESLMLNGIGSKLDIKNRIYMYQAIQKYNLSGSYDIKLLKTFILKYLTNDTILKDMEIKNALIHLNVELLYHFINNDTKYKEINNLVNKISHNKFIIFYSSFNNSYDIYLSYLSIFQFLQEKYNKIIVSINKNQINDIINFIFSNDILIVLDEILFDPIFVNIYRNFSNKIIIICKNININLIRKRTTLGNYSNIYFFIFNYNSYELLKKVIKHENLIYIPNLHLSNLFNYKKNSKCDNDFLIAFSKNITIKENEEIIKIIYKHYHNINYLNLIEELNFDINFIKKIKYYKLIITDNIYLAKLSAIYFTSCIIFGTNIGFQNKDKLFNELKYIKYSNNLKELEENVILLKNIKFHINNRFFKNIFNN
jgi:glycosyltransferase involved in cell wall biosynthesis